MRCVLEELLENPREKSNPSPQVVHLRSEEPFSFEVLVEYHTTDMGVVLDPAPPYGPGQEFDAVIWVQCITEYCDLVGKIVEIYDHTGAKIAEGTLGPQDPHTLRNWVTIRLKAPLEANYYTWTAVFPEQNPHRVLAVPVLVRR